MVPVGVGIHLLENGGDVPKNSCIKKSLGRKKKMKISMYALVNANHNSRITSENFMFYILTLDITDFSEKRNILVSHNASVLLYVCF